ncbi:LOW QUALITY PROTEIN: hypothetical protein U9M48_001804 [Paspalum notatum var. saurae]|uniref:CCHC-type domain-containing protein n=1 Tax=Paspalum notatum var. saurae TaxID=547442 RepID=A0AAQ3PGV9_PASNO
MYMGDSEKFSEFALKVIGVVNKIRNLGTKVENVTVVEKLLRSVPNKFQPIVCTIEQWGDVETMSVAEVVGRLRAFEESLKPWHREREEEKLLMAMRHERRLTRAEWEAIVAEEKRKSDGSGDSGNKGDDKKKYREEVPFDKSKIDCCNYGEFGHFADGCEKPKKMTKGMAHLAITGTDCWI